MSKILKITMMSALVVLSVLTFILALAGGGLFPIILACTLTADVLVGQVLVVIRSIRKKEFLRLAVAGVRIASVILLSLAVIGISVSSSATGGSDVSFNETIDRLQDYRGYTLQDSFEYVGQAGMSMFPESGTALIKLAYNRVWMLIVGLVLCLAASGLAVFLNLRETGNFLYSLLPSFVKKPENAAPRARKAPKAPKTRTPKENAIPIRPDMCCICGRPLTSGYAPLFKLPDGNEARIDESCSNQINVIYSSQDKQQIYSAASYLYGYLPAVNPAVVPYLENYINVGNQKLNK